MSAIGGVVDFRNGNVGFSELNAIKNAYTVMKPNKGGFFMKIVLLRTPSFLSPIIKKIFTATEKNKKGSAAKRRQNGK